MTKVHVVETFGMKVGTWLWCLHCERCYQAGEYREIDGLQYCPYEGCDGTTVLDGERWSGLRAKSPPEYPEVPERGTVYPLY
jgi:hypothetical protein